MLRSLFQETKPERMVREELERRGYIKDKDFIQEKPMRNGFVADFAFPDKMLIIEVDGEVWHPIGNKRDSFRDYVISRSGWKVKRIRENDIYENVQKKVDEVLK